MHRTPLGASERANRDMRHALSPRLQRRESSAFPPSFLISLILSPQVYGYLFSDDASVVALVAQVMPLVASFQVADGLAGSCGGVLRGQGRQHLGAAFNLLAYYVLALPVGITLAFRGGYGLQGLWVGASCLVPPSHRWRQNGC